MTKKELSQLFYLKKEIEMDQRRLADLEVKALPGAVKMDGMPHGTGVSDKLARYAVEMADLRGIIEAKHKQCLYERNRLERYIADIPDCLTRQIFTYRFVDGLSWLQVARRIGGDNTPDSVRMICDRYLSAQR